MTKKHYRVCLYPKYNGVCMELALMALESNGIENGKYSLDDIALIFKAHKVKDKWEVRDCQCHLDEHNLTIYETDKEGNITCLMAIEQVELCKLEMEQPPYLRKEETSY